MTNTKRVGSAAAVAGSVALGLHVVPGVALDVAVDRLVNGNATWLPAFDTIGETVTVYAYAVGILTGLGLLAPGFVLGYRLGRHRRVVSDVRRLVAALALGSTAGVVLCSGGAVLVLALTSGGGGGLVGFGGPSAFALAIGALGLLRAFVEVALVVTVSALAGLAVATFDRDGGPDPTAPFADPSDRSPATDDFPAGNLTSDPTVTDD